jgi:hypothetical protein
MKAWANNLSIFFSCTVRAVCCHSDYGPGLPFIKASPYFHSYTSTSYNIKF